MGFSHLEPSTISSESSLGITKLKYEVLGVILNPILVRMFLILQMLGESTVFLVKSFQMLNASN